MNMSQIKTAKCERRHSRREMERNTDKQHDRKAEARQEPPWPSSFPRDIGFCIFSVDPRTLKGVPSDYRQPLVVRYQFLRQYIQHEDNSYWVVCVITLKKAYWDNHRKLIKLITWTTALSNSVKLWAMPHRATQDGRVMVESSDKRWSTEEGNGKPLQYSCLENPWTVWNGKKIWQWKMNSPGR